jgi:hypothetical protein
MIGNCTENLSSRGVCLDTSDYVLQWTPLCYSERSGSGFMVERLHVLQHDTNGTELVLTGKKVHDPVYIGPTLYEAAVADCCLLLSSYSQPVRIWTNNSLTCGWLPYTLRHPADDWEKSADRSSKTQNATIETTMNELLCSTQPPRAALFPYVGEPSICPLAVLKRVRILILSEIKVRKVMLEVWQ